jgi:hypothetical protein
MDEAYERAIRQAAMDWLDQRAAADGGFHPGPAGVLSQVVTA